MTAAYSKRSLAIPAATGCFIPLIPKANWGIAYKTCLIYQVDIANFWLLVS